MSTKPPSISQAVHSALLHELPAVPGLADALRVWQAAQDRKAQWQALQDAWGLVAAFALGRQAQAAAEAANAR